MDRTKITAISTISKTTVLRAVWLLITPFIIGLALASTPLRYQMLQTDLYGMEDGLQALGLSLSFFAAYFTTWELIFVGGSLAVAALIAWKRSDNWFAMLVAISMTLFGLLPPLVDGLSFAYPTWTIPIATLRVVEMSCLMAVFCLFPNGRFVPKWTGWLFLLWLLYSIFVVFNNPLIGADTAVLPNIRTLEAALWLMIGISWPITAIVGQIIRYRRYANRTEKQQMKWVLFGFTLPVMFSLISVLLIISLPAINRSPDSQTRFILIVGSLYLLSALAIPATFTLSILRYRLWDVDILLNRTLVYGGLTLVVVLIYVFTVGLLSLLFQTSGSFAISLVATGLIAVAFQPVRERLQRSVNRLMFGERDDPYAVLSQLSQQLQTTAVPGETLASIVETIVGALKLPYAAIELVEQAAQIGRTSIGEPVGETVELPLRYQKETVGRLIVSPRAPGEKFMAKEQQLLADIAAQTGAVASATRLTLALQRSRERLVLAREEERRRIRRDLHDGLGPTLASQTLKLDTVLDLLADDPQTAGQHIKQLKSQTQQMVADIRRLVYELRPPALDELGLLEALRAHVAQMSGANGRLRIIIEATPEPLPALPAAIEVATYRIALEGVTNVIRHAQARDCRVRFVVTEAEQPPCLVITITDDGLGLPAKFQSGVGLTSMRERAEELGGTCDVAADEKGGTQVTAALPFATSREAG